MGTMAEALAKAGLVTQDRAKEVLEEQSRDLRVQTALSGYRRETLAVLGMVLYVIPSRYSLAPELSEAVKQVVDKQTGK